MAYITLTDEQAQEFEYAVENLDATVDFQYSGRGMYGSTCVGVIADKIDWVLVHLLGALPDEIAELFDQVDVRTDSMGLQDIAYFPNISTLYTNGDQS